MSVFTGRITMPVRGTCLIQKVSAKLSLGFQEFWCNSYNPKFVVCKHVPNMGSMVNKW